MQRFIQELTKGLWREIPPFRVMLGICPTLAVTKNAENGLGMGVGFTFALCCMGAVREVIGCVIMFAAIIVAQLPSKEERLQ